MKRMIGGFAVIVFLTVVLISWFSSACAPSSLAMTVATPTQTTAPTATTDPTPTPTMDVQDIKESEFNQDIQNFINKTGEFTDEALGNKVLSYKDSKVALGWIGEGPNSVDFQGYFIGYVRVHHYILMAIGFNGSDGENHVKAIGTPLKYFENPNDRSVLFAFEETEDWIMSTSRHIAWESTSEGIINRLNRVVGNPVILNFLGEIDSVTMEKAIDIYGESSRPYFEELSDAAVMVDALMSEVMVSENEKLLSRKTGHQLNSSIKLPEIESLQDLMNADILTVPMVSMISSNLW